MTDLTPRMSIAVTVTVTAAPKAGDRPLYLDPGEAWPPPALMIYLYVDKYGSRTGLGACSDCIRDDEKVAAYWDTKRMPYGGGDPVLTLASRTDNHQFHCTQVGCRKYGDRL